MSSTRKASVPEADIQRLIMLDASGRGYTLWRNNTGQAWQGRKIGAATTGKAHKFIQRLLSRVIGKLMILEDPRPVQFGLCEGSSDLIGFRKVIITPEMVGTEIAQFTAIEVKSARGRATDKQKTFTRFVAKSGGVAVIARDPKEVP